MSRNIVLLAVLAIVAPVVLSQTQTPIEAPTYDDFPFTTDGTVIWVTTLQSLRQPNVGNTRYGADYFDYVCQQSGPQSRTPLASIADPVNDRFYSRAIVCSGSLSPDSAGRENRYAAQFLTYGRPTTQSPAGKPVYAFDAYSVPTQYVKIAENPDALFTSGIDRRSSSVLANHRTGGFIRFYGTDGSFRGLTGPNPPSRALATFPAWTGCNAFGTVEAGLTCTDWSSLNPSQFGRVGNTGYNPNPYIGSFDLTWLAATANPTQNSCNTPSLFIYCSWIPTSDDGWQNGDETAIDCGGSTQQVNGQPQAFCGECPPGTSGPLNGPCVPCAAGRYSWFGGSAACQPCAINANSQQGALYCECNIGYALPSNYDVTTMARDGSLCVPLIRGDPQITGLQGQDFQVHGIPDEYFNMVSTPDMQVNSRFVFLNEARCMDNSTTCFTHPGTYIDVMAFTIGTHKVKVLAGTYEQGLRAFIGDKEIFIGDAQTLENPTVQVSFLAKNRVLVQNGLFRFVLVNSDNFMNQEVALLDGKLLKLGAAQVKVAAGESAPHQEIPIHGILGQTWKNIVYPAGMFIEGEVADYRVADGAFGTDFVYNKFQA